MTKGDVQLCIGKAHDIWPAAGQISYRLYDRSNFRHRSNAPGHDRSNIHPYYGRISDQSWPVKKPDIWPVTALNSHERRIYHPYSPLIFGVHYCHINLLKTLSITQAPNLTLTLTLILTVTLTLTLAPSLILSSKHYATILTQILVISAYAIYNVIRKVATAIFRFDRSNSLQAIWPVAGQIVTAYSQSISKIRDVTCRMGSHSVPATRHRWTRPGWLYRDG